MISIQVQGTSEAKLENHPSNPQLSCDLNCCKGAWHLVLLISDNTQHSPHCTATTDSGGGKSPVIVNWTVLVHRMNPWPKRLEWAVCAFASPEHPFFSYFQTRPMEKKQPPGVKNAFQHLALTSSEAEGRKSLVLWAEMRKAPSWYDDVCGQEIQPYHSIGTPNSTCCGKEMALRPKASLIEGGQVPVLANVCLPHPDRKQGAIVSCNRTSGDLHVNTCTQLHPRGNMCIVSEQDPPLGRLLCVITRLMIHRTSQVWLPELHTCSWRGLDRKSRPCTHVCLHTCAIHLQYMPMHACTQAHLCHPFVIGCPCTLAHLHTCTTRLRWMPRQASGWMACGTIWL